MLSSDRFTVVVTVVPPAGSDPEPLLASLVAVDDLPFDAFSVASNPLAEPRMSALAFSVLLREQVSKPVILHCTMRDLNFLSVDSLLWGAKALGIETVLITTGDAVALRRQTQEEVSWSVSIFDMVREARKLGFGTGVVLDPAPGVDGFMQGVRRLMWKARAGAQFVITQPIYDEAGAEALSAVAQQLDIPLLLGLLPLLSAGHMAFLDRWVAGISVPDSVRDRIVRADDPSAAGLANAREMLAVAKERFAGVCLMPSPGRYEMVAEILS